MMGLSFNHGTYATFKGKYKVDVVNGEKYRNVVGYLKIAMPTIPINPLTQVYRGNVQLSVNNNWAGQWELNSLEFDGSQSIPDNAGLIHKYFQFTLPDNIAQEMLNSSVDIKVSVSAANSNGGLLGEQFYLDNLSFQATDESLPSFKFSIFSSAFAFATLSSGKYDWDKYVTGETSGYSLNGYSIVRRAGKYYALRKDDEFPMYLTHLWAKNAAYEPGNPQGPWRQCWTEVNLIF